MVRWEDEGSSHACSPRPLKSSIRCDGKSLPSIAAQLKFVFPIVAYAASVSKPLITKQQSIVPVPGIGLMGGNLVSILVSPDKSSEHMYVLVSFLDCWRRNIRKPPKLSIIRCLSVLQSSRVSERKDPPEAQGIELRSNCFYQPSSTVSSSDSISIPTEAKTW